MTDNLIGFSSILKFVRFWVNLIGACLFAYVAFLDKWEDDENIYKIKMVSGLTAFYSLVMVYDALDGYTCRTAKQYFERNVIGFFTTCVVILSIYLYYETYTLYNNFIKTDKYHNSWTHTLLSFNYYSFMYVIVATIVVGLLDQ